MCNSCVMHNTLDIIGTAEAARLLDMDRSTLTRQVAAGRIPSVFRASGSTGELFFARAEIESRIPKTTLVSAVAPDADTRVSSASPPGGAL